MILAAGCFFWSLQRSKGHDLDELVLPRLLLTFEQAIGRRDGSIVRFSFEGPSGAWKLQIEPSGRRSATIEGQKFIIGSVNGVKCKVGLTEISAIEEESLRKLIDNNLLWKSSHLRLEREGRKLYISVQRIRKVDTKWVVIFDSLRQYAIWEDGTVHEGSGQNLSFKEGLASGPVFR